MHISRLGQAAILTREAALFFVCVSGHSGLCEWGYHRTGGTLQESQLVQPFFFSLGGCPFSPEPRLVLQTSAW